MWQIRLLQTFITFTQRWIVIYNFDGILLVKTDQNLIGLYEDRIPIPSITGKLVSGFQLPIVYTLYMSWAYILIVHRFYRMVMCIDDDDYDDDRWELQEK